MRHIVETGTDVAIVTFFDAGALPKDYEEQAKADQMTAFERLSQAGRLWWLETGADGAYLFHFYVDQALPELIRKHSVEPKATARFLVPSGEIWACGAEYVAVSPRQGYSGTPKGGLEKYPHMGGSFKIPSGEYQLTAWRTEWPDELIEDEIKKRIGVSAWRRQEGLGQTTGCLFFLLALGTLACIGFAFSKASMNLFGPNTAWFWGVLGITWVICAMLIRALKKMESHSPRKEVEREFPSIVVEMKRLQSSAKET